MGIEHVCTIMEEGQWNTHMGKKLWMSLKAMKVEVGLGGSLLSQSFQRYGMLATKSLVKHTWQFLHEHKMAIADKVRGSEPMLRI